jgi:hypothetical protein
MTLNRVRVMAFNANFNNISVIYIVAGSFNDGENRHTWRKPPYLEKTAIPGENRHTWRKPPTCRK